MRKTKTAKIRGIHVAAEVVTGEQDEVALVAANDTVQSEIVLKEVDAIDGTTDNTMDTIETETERKHEGNANARK